jgi:DNA invertase Pin-like site-specific DNA recombinase
MSQPPVRAALYDRLSRKGGRSIERQEADGRALAAERGWQVVTVFKETVSASEYGKGERKEWRALLEAVGRGEFDAIILWMEDRSSRDLIDAAAFVRLCRDAGLRHVVVTGQDYGYDLSNHDDRLRFYQAVLDAEREIAKMSKRVRRARLQEAEEGHPNPGGKRAFGDSGGKRVRDPAKDDDDPEKWLRDEHGRWLRTGAIPDEQLDHERRLIREAGRRVRAGDSLRGIVADWRARGITAAGGEPWTTRSLRRMLLSPRLAGLREHRGTLHESDEIEAAIPRAEWEEVRTILTDPARMEAARSPLVAGKGGVARHLLAGFCFCGVCTARLRVDRVGGARVYCCPSASDGGRRCVQRDAARLERLIVGALFKAVESRKWAQLAARPDGDDPTRELGERLARDQARLDKLDDALTLAEIDGDKRQATSIRRVRAEVEDRMERTRRMINRRQGNRVVAEVPRNLRAVWGDLGLDRRRAIIAAVLKLPPEGKGIVIHPQGHGRHVFNASTIEPDWRV